MAELPSHNNTLNKSAATLTVSGTSITYAPTLHLKQTYSPVRILFDLGFITYRQQRARFKPSACSVARFNGAY